MKFHLQALELFIGLDGKTKYRHKRTDQFGTITPKAVCGKNVSSHTVEIPEWYEYLGKKSPYLCQHCVKALNKKKQEIKAA